MECLTYHISFKAIIRKPCFPSINHLFQVSYSAIKQKRVTVYELKKKQL